MRFRFFTLILVLVSLTACDRFIHSNGSKPPGVIIAKTKEFECLKAWPGQLKSYFQDDLDSEQTAKLFTCVDGALGTFEKFAKGRTAGQFSSDELQEFLNRYMLKESEISTAFMVQLMNLKVLFLGGSSGLMSAEELRRSHQLISLLSTQAQSLRGHWKMLLFDADPAAVNFKDIEATKQLVLSTVTTLIDFSKIESSNYSWVDFRSLLDDSEAFMGAAGLMSNLEKWMPFTDSVRELFLGQALDLSKKAGWQESGRWTVEVYAGSAKVFYGTRHANWSSATSWTNFIDFADLALQLLNSSPQYNKNQVLHVSDMDRVVEEVVKLDLLPVALTAPIMKDLYKHFFAILKQGESMTGAGSVDWTTIKEFDSDMMGNLMMEYRVWKFAELQIVSNFSKDEAVPLRTVILHAGTVDAGALVTKWNLDLVDQERLLRSWTDWKGILNTRHPLTFVSGTHLVIPANPLTVTADVSSLTILNSLRTFVRMVEMGYGLKQHPSDDLWDGVMRQGQAISWEKDFEAFGRAIHFLDPRQNDSAQRFYGDSGYFAFSANGATARTSQQMLELIALMISGGKVVADQMMKSLEADHCLTQMRDPSFNEPMADQKCFERSLYFHVEELFANLPGLLQDIRNTRMSRGQLIQELEIIAHDATKPAGYIEYGEIRTMATVLHYLEALMAVFDTNHDEYLDQAEVTAAYPRFKQIVASVSPMGDHMTEDAFLYLVYRGKKPVVTGWKSGASAAGDFGVFVGEKLYGLGKVPRIQLLKVLAVLKQSTDAQNMVATGKRSATLPPP